MENVIDESWDFKYCRKRADDNKKETGNETVVKHVGFRTSGLSKHPYFIVIEVLLESRGNHKERGR